MSRSERAYERLHRDVLDGRWLDGTMLSTYALAEELGMSRTPVIDALKRLEGDGLVEIVPQVGCRVVQRTAEDAVEALRIRAALEGLAAEYAGARITEHELRSLRAILGEGEKAARHGDVTAYEEIDRAFHEAIVRASRMPQLEKLIRTVWQLNRPQIGELRTHFLSGRLGRSLDEHRRIIQVLTSREPQVARAAVEQHLRSSAADFEELAHSDQANDRAMLGRRDIGI